MQRKARTRWPCEKSLNRLSSKLGSGHKLFDLRTSKEGIDKLQQIHGMTHPADNPKPDDEAEAEGDTTKPRSSQPEASARDEPPSSESELLSEPEPPSERESRSDT
ncbi:hypothetical protein SH467x_003518 [Pirellulaceae bacterium SH467]